MSEFALPSVPRVMPRCSVTERTEASASVLGYRRTGTFGVGVGLHDMLPDTDLPRLCLGVGLLHATGLPDICLAECLCLTSFSWTWLSDNDQT